MAREFEYWSSPLLGTRGLEVVSMWGPFGGGGWVWMPLMMFFGFLFFLGFVLLMFWIARHLFSGDSRRSETPLEILKRRYASGEINREEYERMRHELE